MARAFTVKHLGRAPARFEESQLNVWQREVAHHMPLEESERWLAAETPPDIDAERRRAFIAAIRPERAAARGRRALARSGVWRRRPRSMRRSLARVREAGAQFFRAAADAAATGGKLDAIVNAVKAATGAKGQALWKPLRLALTGTPEGPELAPLLQAMPDSSHPRPPEPLRRMIRIHNSLTGEKQELKPVEPGHVRMYSCGITVYDYFHVGNARMLVVFDMVSRYLRHRGHARHLRAQHHRRRRQDHQPRARERASTGARTPRNSPRPCTRISTSSDACARRRSPRPPNTSTKC